MPTAVWTGSLSFGLVTVPVRLIPATEPKDVRFHLNAAFAFAPFFRGTLLVMNEHGNPGSGFQFVHGLEEFFTRRKRGNRCQLRPTPALRRFRDHNDLFHPFSSETMGKLRDRHAPLGVLAASHSHCAIIEELESHIHSSRHTGT